MTREQVIDKAIQIYWLFCLVLLGFVVGYLIGDHFAAVAGPGEAEVAIITVTYGEDVPPAETHPTASQEAAE